MQRKKSFDKETRDKIFKSLLLTILSASAAGITAYSQGSSPKQALLIGASTFITFIANSIREYYNGEEKNEDKEQQSTNQKTESCCGKMQN